MSVCKSEEGCEIDRRGKYSRGQRWAKIVPSTCLEKVIEHQKKGGCANQGEQTKKQGDRQTDKCDVNNAAVPLFGLAWRLFRSNGWMKKKLKGWMVG
jgi:hypothetical protein